MATDFLLGQLKRASCYLYCWGVFKTPIFPI